MAAAPKGNSHNKSCALASAIFFLMFLVASAPHRVHHLLEQLPSRPEVPAADSAVVDEPAPSQFAANAKEISGHDHIAHPHGHAHHHHHHHHRAPAPAEPAQKTARPAKTVIERQGSESEPSNASAPRQDGHHAPSAQNDCFVLAAAQNSHLAKSSCIASATREISRSYDLDPLDCKYSESGHATAAPRAPPGRVTRALNFGAPLGALQPNVAPMRLTP